MMITTVIAAAVVCAWCPKVPGAPPLGPGVSHGICPACYAAQLVALDRDERIFAAMKRPFLVPRPR